MEINWWQRAKNVLPGGVNSPVRSFKHIGTDPIYFQSAKGAEIVSVDGKRYVDFCMGFGPHILGHSPEVVVNAVSRQLGMGTSFGACNPLEVEFAEKLLLGYPYLHQARLVNSGTEAVMTALRIARAKTGRGLILKFEGCYHGHFDSLLVSAGSGLADLPFTSSKGVTKGTLDGSLVGRLDNPESWDRIFQLHGADLAAVIVEPVPANEGLYLPKRVDLEKLSRLTRSVGACLIFDEVISGFRLGLSGASGALDIRPDLVTLGKVIGGGLPLAAVLGGREWIEQLAPLGGAYQAGTFSGNVLSVTAGLSVVKELMDHPPFDALEARTSRFANELGQILKDFPGVRVMNTSSIFWIQFDESKRFPPTHSSESLALFRRFYIKSLERGIYFPPSPYEVSFLSTCHTDTLLDDVLERLSGVARELA